MIDAIGSGMQGLQRATQQLNQSAERIAGGDLEPEPIIDSKVAEHSFKANAASIKTAFEIQETALDLLA